MISIKGKGVAKFIQIRGSITSIKNIFAEIDGNEIDVTNARGGYNHNTETTLKLYDIKFQKHLKIRMEKKDGTNYSNELATFVLYQLE